MTSRAADLIRDIDSANLAARRSEIRKLPLSDRRVAGDAADRAHRAAVNAFAALNGWQATKCGFNCLDLLGCSAMSDSLRLAARRLRVARPSYLVLPEPSLRCRCGSALSVGH